MADQWVIRQEARFQHLPKPNISFWLGEGSLFSNTWGPITMAKKWPTRKAAEAEYRMVFRRWNYRHHETRAQRLSEAVEETKFRDPQPQRSGVEP